MPRRNSQGIPRRSQAVDPTHPIPRRGAGRGGGKDRSRRARTGRGLRTLNPFDVTGRQRVGQSLREQEEEPYRYDSNDRQIFVVKILLVLWVGLAIVSAVAQFREREAIADWGDAQFTSLPGDLSTNGINLFLVEHQISCESDPVTGEVTGVCRNAFDLGSRLDSARDLEFGIFSGFLFLFVVISVMVASFAYQANRNLLTLKSEGQRFSGTSAMLWLFVPLLNFFKGAQIFGEIWRGSDPNGDPEGGEEWKSRSSKWWIDVWWITLAIVITLNILFRTRFSTNEIDERLTLAWIVILSDLFMIVPAVLAYKTMKRIHEMQEKRHEIVGDHLAVPPYRGLTL